MLVGNLVPRKFSFALRLEAMESVLFDWLLSGSIPHLRNSKENGYRLWVQ